MDGSGIGGSGRVDDEAIELMEVVDDVVEYENKKEHELEGVDEPEAGLASLIRVGISWYNMMWISLCSREGFAGIRIRG